MAKTDLTAQRLREFLHYDPETGIFEWKCRTTNRVKPGEPTGVKITTYGYARVGIDGKVYQAHRLAWFYVYGEWPSGQLDHINGIRHDNRLANLRDVQQSVNSQNLKRARKDSKCGLLGVSTNGKKWRSRIVIDDKAIHLGTFDSPELAHAAYIAAKRKHHEGCTI